MFPLRRNSELLVIFFFSFFVITCISTEYSKVERDALDKIRPLVVDSLTHDYQKVDSYLIRWLRARDMDVKRAINMLLQSQEWRKDNKIDTILTEPSIFEEVGSVESTDAFDREERPVTTFITAKVDFRRLILEGKLKKMIRGNILLWEKMAKIAYESSNRTGSDISQAMIVSDMAGFTRIQHLCVQCLNFAQEWIDIEEKYYPGFLKLNVLVNVPRHYEFLLERTRSLRSPHTREVTKFFGHDKREWSAYLDKYIAPEQRTAQFGGTKKL